MEPYRTAFVSADGVMKPRAAASTAMPDGRSRTSSSIRPPTRSRAVSRRRPPGLPVRRQTYEEFAPVWPTMEEFAEYNAMPRYVVSTTLASDDAAGQPPSCVRSTRWPN